VSDVVRLNGCWTTIPPGEVPAHDASCAEALEKEGSVSTIYRVTPEERVESQPTPGIVREQAVRTEGMWSGLARTDAGMVSGWHHHGVYESTIYVLTGSLRMEFGAGGQGSFDAGPGDFVFVGKEIVHRESNPSGEEATFVVVRAGEGEAVVNVDGPE
jgi:uncharacterized RmlC-like cupin family protein